MPSRDPDESRADPSSGARDESSSPVAPSRGASAPGGQGQQAPCGSEPGPCLTVGYVPGVMPGKWFTRWRRRGLAPRLEDQLVRADQWRAALQDGTVTACFVRLGWSPEDPALDELRSTHHAVHLYDERQVAVLGAEDLLTVLDTLTTAQLREESTPQPHADLDDAAMAVELAAAGAGPVVLPMSVARLHARKDVTTRELTDAPTVPVVLVWPRFLDEDTEDAVQRFVGVVRGRRESSGREEAGRAASSSGAGRHAPRGAVEKRPAGQSAGRGGRARASGRTRTGAGAAPGRRRASGRTVKGARRRTRP